ncbi:kinesin [Perkinsela sp. CCAP 1560/4]|nr:kinesin [Perkinsela sp. CCAP 1560/4]|eukprot:KNH08198.1 kinesin [Perkinsela sp. CCAP 1560/4]
MSFGIADTVPNKMHAKAPSTEPLTDRLDKYPQLSKDEIIARYLEKMRDASATVESSMKLTPVTVRGISSVVRDRVPLIVGKRPVSQPAQSPRQSKVFDEIAVYLRIRPLDSTQRTARSELQYEVEPPTDAESPRKEWTLKVHACYTTRVYRFAKIFDPSITNPSLNLSLWPLVHAKLQSERDVSLMCYGPTGSGKTYTMEGLFPFIFHGLFEEYASSATFEIAAIQIYCDKAYNLLSLNSSVRASKNGLGQPFTSSEIDQRKVPSVEIRSYTEGMRIIENAQKRRVQRCNFLNNKSSRSHTIIFLYMKTQDVKRQITFIDLAGSERVKRTGSIGQAFDEGVSINKSLSSLFGLFSAIQRDTTSSQDGLHAPSRSYLFRGNLLTRYLYSMKNSFFLLIANISSDASSFNEVKTSLDFAALSRKIGIASRNIKSNEGHERRSPTKKYSDNLHLSLDIFTFFDAHEVVQPSEQEEKASTTTSQDRREQSDEAPEIASVESEKRHKLTMERTCIADMHPLHLCTQEPNTPRESRRFTLVSMDIFEQTPTPTESVTPKADFLSVKQTVISDIFTMSDENSEVASLDISVDSTSIQPIECTVIDPFNSTDGLSQMVFYPVNDSVSDSASVEAILPAPSKAHDGTTTSVDASIIIIAVLSLVYNFFDLFTQYFLRFLVR